MKQVTVLSGKGGTGKTTLVGALASLAPYKVLGDCDVDAADLFLILEPENLERGDFYSGHIPIVNLNECTQCGTCTELCRYDAIDNGSVDLVACEHCGLCALACPVECITMEDALCGEWFVAETRYGPMVHARLGIGQENSGKLVAEVIKLSRSLAEERDIPLVIIDGPPGIGCPVISSMAGADGILVVTEPTVSGVHDLQRIIGVTQHFNIPAFVCINKYDINPDKAADIETYCRDQDVAMLGKIPFDVEVVHAMVEQKTVMEHPCPVIQETMEHIWKGLQQALLDGDGAS
jgi:MinD superfamily P-loop ATPase